MHTIHLEVQGMSCSGCVKSVTAALKLLTGVSSVEIDLPTRHVTVRGDHMQGGDSLVLALKVEGYPAILTCSTTAANAAAGVKKSGSCCG